MTTCLYTECFEELINDLKKIGALSESDEILVPDVNSFLSYVKPLEKDITNKVESFLMRYPFSTRDKRILFLTPDSISNNGKITLHEYQERTCTLFKYFENLFVYAHLKAEGLEAPSNIVKKNLSSYRGNKQSNLLKSMLQKVESAIKPQLDSNKAQNLINKIAAHKNDPMQILNVLQSSELNVMDLVHQLSADIKQKVDNKEISEEEIQSCLSDIMVMNSDLLNNIKLE